MDGCKSWVQDYQPTFELKLQLNNMMIFKRIFRVLTKGHVFLRYICSKMQVISERPAPYQNIPHTWTGFSILSSNPNKWFIIPSKILSMWEALTTLDTQQVHKFTINLLHCKIGYYFQAWMKLFYQLFCSWRIVHLPQLRFKQFSIVPQAYIIQLKRFAILGLPD